MSLADLSIGRYYPAESVIHSVNARAKLISVLALSIAAFMTSSFYSLIFLFAFVIYVLFLSKLPLRWIYKAVKPVFYLLAIAFIFQAFFIPGQVFLRFWVLKVTYEGLSLGAFVVLRILIIIIFGSIFSFTTSPTDMADGLESLMAPLRLIKFPVQETALAVTLALRFIPDLLSEAQEIAFAQTARGADFKSGNIFKRTKALIPLFIPLLVISFRKADDLGKAMEARCYQTNIRRTIYFEDNWALSDSIALSIVVLVSMISVFIR